MKNILIPLALFASLNTFAQTQTLPGSTSGGTTVHNGIHQFPNLTNAWNDTSNYKFVVINTSTNRLYKTTYWGMATLAGAETLTNKRVSKRVVTVTQSATPTVNSDLTDIAKITSLAQDITSMTSNLSGTPTFGQELIFFIKDNGTARNITWGASFVAGTVTLPAATTANTDLWVNFYYNGSTWACMGKSY